MIDASRNHFSVSLDPEELSFISFTAYASSKENAALVRSLQSGQTKEDPFIDCFLPEKSGQKDTAASFAVLYYQFTYHIGGRCINPWTAGQLPFWDETDLETLLSMNKDDAAAKLQDIAERYSNDSITVNILPEGILFEAMDERSNRQ